MEYNFTEIEKKWQAYWQESKIYKVEMDTVKPKYYVLDMFPYPSGAGLHVGHPLGYIASDVFARYKRLKGYNVLHPMGFDSFGLPAEQYAIETGQHPAVTTEKNIATYKTQLQMLGFCYDWDREVSTSDPDYYKWTQWIFLKLFNSWYNKESKKAEPITTLISKFESNGSQALRDDRDFNFKADQWKEMTEAEQQEILMHFRLAFSSFGEVNWCEALGTVLANDEVVNGVSERGGYPVVKKKMRQWYLRITDYADRLLEGLEKVDYSEAMKEMQRNWIGRSEGAELDFKLMQEAEKEGEEYAIRVYTTRPDTIFGVDFMVLAPEHELVEKITTDRQREEIDAYLKYVKSRSDRERLSEVKQITGCFTGAYAINPFSGKQVPVWTAEYVLGGYGTGAIMAVPCGDERDFNFARHFNIPITNIIGANYTGEEANPTKDAILENSGFLNGLKMKDAIGVAIKKIEADGIGKRKVNYKMRDAGYSRQRYWGEPFPIIWKEGVAYALDEKDLPLKLPFVEKYGPGKNGEGPLSNLEDWVNVDYNPVGGTDTDLHSTLPGRGVRGEVSMLSPARRETSTMPGYAGSSWYFLRFADPRNRSEFADKAATDYWNQVDLYIGGTEHAVGHLLYSRMWTKFLFDYGYISFDEPYKRLVNQGMITGKSFFFKKENGKIVSADVRDEGEFVRFKYGHRAVDSNGKLLKKVFEDLSKSGRISVPEFEIAWEKEGNEEFIYVVEESEKMSKSKFNVENPDDLVARYGADTFRMYEMFLGPIEQSKPWDTKGIEGVHRFLKKLWRLFVSDEKGGIVTDEKPSPEELKVLHKTIKKVQEDIERFSLNTAVSAFMVCVNELTDLKCHKNEILTPLLVLLSPYAPHIAEELYHLTGHSTSVVNARFPELNTEYLVETEKEYPVSINGKLRTTINISLNATQEEVEKIALENEVVQKWMEGKPVKRVIFVKNRMINVVV